MAMTGRHHSGAASSVLRGIDRVLSATRRTAGRTLDVVTFRLRVLEARLDPEGESWANEVKDAARRGELRDRIARQSTPEQILNDWRSGGFAG